MTGSLERRDTGAVSGDRIVVVGISVDPRSGAGRLRSLCRELTDAISAIEGESVTAWEGESSAILAPSRLPRRHLDDFSLEIPLALTARGRRRAPFAALTHDREIDEIVAECDDVALRHLYLAERHDWAAVATSSAVLGALVGAGLDEHALATLALCGNLLGTQTPFRSVRKLQAGETLRLARGAAFVEHTPLNDGLERGRVVNLGVARSTGSSAISSAVRDAISVHDDLALELSGGLDSRMLLAAIPEERRRGMVAFTLDRSGGAESRVASRIATAVGLDHHIVDITPLDHLDMGAATRLVHRSSVVHDHSGNPVSSAVLDWVEARVDQSRPRLTGQNGEYARGFYYAGQRDHARTTRSLAGRLARWRVFANDLVDPGLFDHDFYESAMFDVQRRIEETLLGYELPWLAATDEFYLRERMQRWVGLGFSYSCMHRHVVAPFFDPAFIRWSAMLEPGLRRHSQAFAAVLADLSPALAAFPLSDERPAPVSMAERGLGTRVHGWRMTAGKVVSKVRQRIVRRGRPPAGTDHLARMQAQAWVQMPDSLQRVAALPFVDSVTVEQVARGERSLDPATVGFLATLQHLAATVR